MTFDPTISLGNILTVVGFIVTVAVAAIRLEGRLTRLETMVGPMWEAYRKYLAWVGTGGVERRQYPPIPPEGRG